MNTPEQQTSDSAPCEEENTSSVNCANVDQCEISDDEDTWRNKVVENFEIVKYISRGSYGRILKIREKSTGSFYALKVISKHRREDDPLSESQILREKNIMEKLGYHPFLVEFHSAYDTQNHIALIMGYIDGIPLIDYQQNFGVPILRENEAAFYTAEISLGLHYLHKKGVIHRDLKPDNILINSDGHIKIIDYGFAKDGLGFNSTTTTTMSTGLFAASEIFLKLPYTFAADWFALGVILCLMLTDRYPFISINDIDSEDLSLENCKTILSAMLDQELKIDKDALSAEAVDILEQLLKLNQRWRLGSNDSDDRMEIAEHPFFKDIDWIELENKRVKPPFIPTRRDEADN